MSKIHSKALQVLMQVADIHHMRLGYQQMGSEERLRHHDELRNEGFEWCPECGSVLVWDVPQRKMQTRFRERNPIVSGDCPPLTAEQLADTSPDL